MRLSDLKAFRLLLLPVLLVPGAWADRPGDLEFPGQEVRGPFILSGQLQIETSGSRLDSLVIAVHHPGPASQPSGRSPHLEVEIGHRTVRISCVEGKTKRSLAEGRLDVSENSIGLAVRRDAWRLAIFIGGQHVATAYEPSLSGGRIGLCQIGRSVRVEKLAWQPLEPILFADDFTRSEDRRGEWQVLRGEFKLHQITAQKYTQQVFSVNAFRWESRGQGLDLASAGHWFWKDYRLSASIRPTSPGIVGLCIWLQDPVNYVAFLCESGRAPLRCRLVRVRNGEAETLAEGVSPCELHQWVRLHVRAVDQSIEAGADGQTLLRAESGECPGGRIGLLADRCVAQFDDVHAVSVDGCLVPETRWPVPLRIEIPGQGKFLECRFGADRWTDWNCTLRFPYPILPEVRVAYGADPGDDVGWLELGRSGSAGHAVSIRAQGDARRELAETPLPRRFSQLQLDASGHALSLSTDGDDRLDWFDSGSTSGPVRVRWRSGEIRRFPVLEIRTPLRSPVPPILPAQFSAEATMAGWASSAADWHPNAAARLEYASPLFGDYEVALTGIVTSAPAVPWTLVLANESHESLGTLKATPNQPAGHLQLQLASGTEPARSASLPASDQRDVSLRLVRRRDQVAVLRDQDAILHARVTRNGGAEYVECLPPGLPAAALAVQSPSLIDEFFSNAPVQWRVGRGQWDVVPRWPCDDRWSWLGGTDSESPVLWSRNAFHGDQVVDAWLALYMDRPDEPTIGYAHPSDLNLTICGDSRNLSSGYSFLFAAKSNTCSLLLKRDQVLGENPQMHMLDPRRTNLAFQRHWYHLRIQKAGNRITCWLDGVKAFDVNDPSPLAGGSVALWTWSGGLMVARVRISAQEVRPAPVSPLPPMRTAPAEPGWHIEKPPVRLICRFEEGLGGWRSVGEPGTETGWLPERAGSCLAVRNAVSGGPFSIHREFAPFDAARFPVVSFRLRAAPGTKINLYAQVNDFRVALPLTAPEWREAGITVLAAAPIAADAAWHDVRYDLAAALRQQFPSVAAFTVRSFEFAAPSAEYLRSGFGGNPFGAAYHLDDFALWAADGVSEEEAARLVRPGVP